MRSLIKKCFKKWRWPMKKKKKKAKAKKKTVVKKKPPKKAKKKAVKKTKGTVARKKKTKTKPIKVKKGITGKIRSVPAGTSLEEIGVVTHYFPHVEAAVVKITGTLLSVGDTIVIKGHTTDFKEKVNSIQMDHASIEKATVGQEIGLKVKSKV
ncbi:MAG: hypothetical protein KKH08_02805, partial [Candidatus Omnitrophica bacterium]|nr:hypothetical protein [Candidatus Omnitrophota bacterium]